MAKKFTYLFLFACIIFVLCSYVSAERKVIPFDYKVFIRKTTNGDNFKISRTKRVCNTYQSLFFKRAANTTIQLVQNRPRRHLESFQYPNDGKRHTHCWPKHNAKKVYHF